MSLTDDQIVAKNFKKYHEAILPYLNGSAHSGFTPIGTVISVMGTTAPMNYLACDGTIYNIADYTELAAYFNQQFGSSNFFGGDGTTTFAVPDLRGEFLRGWGTNSHANQGSGANVGVHQDGTIHTNIIGYGGSSPFFQINSRKSDGTTIAAEITDFQHDRVSEVDAVHELGHSTAPGVKNADYTSRPTNTSVLYCIASKNIFMDAGSNYSTEEQVVGTWIDGKPIYQKTISFNINAGGQALSVDHNVGYIDKVINYEAIAITNNDNNFYKLPFISGNTASIKNATVWDVTKTKINYISNEDLYAGTVYVTILYTKTTD